MPAETRDDPLHNPRCLKSRAALAPLQQHGVSPRIISYLETPPSADALRTLRRQPGLPARKLLRSGKLEYAELDLADPTTSHEHLIAAMAAQPRLIERPVFVHGDHVVVGRPSERVL